MDLDIWSKYNSIWMDSPYQRHIQVDSLHRGYQYNRINKSTSLHHFVLCISHWTRMEMGYMEKDFQGQLESCKTNNKIIEGKKLLNCLVIIIKDFNCSTSLFMSKFERSLNDKEKRKSLIIIERLKKKGKYILNLTWSKYTLYERIATIIAGANTHGCMTDNATFSINSTRSKTRIFAFLIHAGQITGTFTITNTFWFTIRRGAYKFWWTGTRGWVVDNSTLRIRPAWRRFAWILWYCRLWC